MGAHMWGGNMKKRSVVGIFTHTGTASSAEHAHPAQPYWFLLYPSFLLPCWQAMPTAASAGARWDGHMHASVFSVRSPSPLYPSPREGTNSVSTLLRMLAFGNAP